MKSSTVSKIPLIFLLLSFWLVPNAHSEDNDCGKGWRALKDEKCFRAFGYQYILTYSKGQRFCKDLDKDATLPSIRNKEEQTFLKDFLIHENITNKVWLGAQKVEGNFKWEDKSPFTFTSWANKTDLDKNCVITGNETKAEEGQWKTEDCSNVNVVICQKCQSWSTSKMQNLLLKVREELRIARMEAEEAKSEVLKTKLKLQSLEVELSASKNVLNSSAQQITALQSIHNSTSSRLQSVLLSDIATIKSDILDLKVNVIDGKNTTAEITKRVNTVYIKTIQSETNLEVLNSSVLRTSQSISGVSEGVDTLRRELLSSKNSVLNEISGMKGNIEKNKTPPIGFIYVQYYGQPAPSTLWPGGRWTEVTSNYAGLFFRAAGGLASAFGQTQSDFAPRVTTVYFSNKDTHRHTSTISLNMGATSDPITAGGWDGGWTGLKFYTSSGEVRPRNQAILIFKRIS